MFVARLLEGYDAAARSGTDDRQLEDVVKSAKASRTANPPANESSTSQSPLPRASPVSYTSHAMMLQLQEYQSRVRSAFQSTYRHPLAIAPPTAAGKTPGSPKRGTHSGNHCRGRVLESSRQLFSAEARRTASAIPVSQCSPSRSSSVKGGGVAFHRTTTAPRTPAQSSLFALGPGQYDVVPRRPATTGSVKFSPADRFREHAGGGKTDPHAPGPGQYLLDDRITARRSARVVFSQLPRQTETAEPPRAAVTAPSATADVVSSYYYLPASGFASPGDSVAKTGGGIPNWSRTARFPGRRREFHQTVAQESPAVDHIARNKAKIESMSAQQRQRRRLQQKATQLQQTHKDTEIQTRKSSSVRRRNSVFCSPQTPACSVQNDMKDLVTRKEAWGTLVVLSVAQTKLARLLVVAAVLHRLRSAQEMRYKRVTFESWTRARDRDAMRSLASALIARSTFRFRLNLLVARKICAASLLRAFLSGLSVDVRFAMAVRRMQRRIMLLQRWWRRARLVVRAREQCLAYKWLAVEQRLRADHIAQMPHLQRVFQPPQVCVTSGSSNSLVKRRTSVIGAATQTVAVEAQLPLHKLLNLPEQKRWFSARFVLSSDGVLRGYSTPESGTKAEDALGERLVVETKHFRCHAHGFANVSLGSTRQLCSEDEGENGCRPYLMVFRPGESRFILITDMTIILAPLLDWKEKLERVAGYSVGTPIPNGGFQSDIADMLSQTDISAIDDVNDDIPARRGSISVSANGERSPLGANRRRSSRHPLRRSNVFQPIAEGELSYYVVDLLRDCPRIPAPVVRSALREKIREERKNFRSDIYRFKLEIARYQQHERERRQLVVLDKFKEFFTMERPRHPHFRSLISNRKMETLVRQTIELTKTTQPSNPKFMLP